MKVLGLGWAVSSLETPAIIQKRKVMENQKEHGTEMCFIS